MSEFAWPRFIGMVHLLPLPGSPRYGGSLSQVREAAMRDASTLESGGVDGIMIENFGDSPFFPESVPQHVVATMTSICGEIRNASRVPVGVNVLRNDGLAALAIANAIGADFIRVNILTGARLTDQGIISGIAHDLMRLRASLGSQVRVMADIDVKHSAPIAEFSLEDEIGDTIERGMADAIIVSGHGTGKEPDCNEVETVKKLSKRPVYIGSGMSVENYGRFSRFIDGLIVGSSLKENNNIFSPVDIAKVKSFRSAIN